MSDKLLVEWKASDDFVLPNSEVAYLAGLIDGEGCIAINKVTHSDYKRLGFQLRISACMTHRLTVERLHSIFGGSFIVTPRTRGKTAYQWSQSASGALKAINILRPYLIVKAPQALVAVEFQNERATNKTQEQWQKEYNLYLEMKELNKRWSEND